MFVCDDTLERAKRIGVKERTITNLFLRSTSHLWDLEGRADVGIANRTEKFRPIRYMAQGSRLACTAEPTDAHLMLRLHSLLSKSNDERSRSDPLRELPQKYPHKIPQRLSPDRHQGLRLLIGLESWLVAILGMVCQEVHNLYSGASRLGGALRPQDKELCMVGRVVSRGRRVKN